ncbi:MAG: hypothetical protein R2942_19300 [Ignavibacteria bacterium]
MLMNLAKSDNFSVFIVGHITKEGMIAGPKVLEHMVDVVLRLKEKNPFIQNIAGNKKQVWLCNEIGIFEMTEAG